MKFKDKKLTFLRRIKYYFFGIFWTLVSGVMFVSVLSYNENDISFNEVSTKLEVHNYLGKFGSYTADLLVQILGLTSLFFAGLFLILGFNVFFNKTIYNKWQKFISFIGLIISSSIIFDILFISKKCDLSYCGGLVGSFFVDALYYIPSYMLILFSGLVFFISISFFLDIRKYWWLVKSARFYNFTKSVFNGIFSVIAFIFKLLTTRNFRNSIKRFFVNIS